MEKIKTKIDGSTIKELFSNLIISTVVGTVIGLGFLLAYIFISLSNDSWKEMMNVTFLVVGIILFLVSTFVLFKIVSTFITTRNSVAQSVSDFQDNSVNIVVQRENKEVDNANIPYEAITSFSVKKSYIFLKLSNRGVFPITKTDGLEEFLLSKGIKRK